MRFMGGKVAGEELLDLLVCNLPTGKLLEHLYASCAARTVQDDGSVRISNQRTSGELSGSILSKGSVRTWS
jgi:hypothetical protein